MSDGRPLEVARLTHSFAGVRVLDDVGFNIEEGEFLAVLGPSGCGKTTLLRSIAGLVVPDAGEIRIAGVDCVRDGRQLVPVERRGVGLVFQEYALFPYQNVRGNVGFALRGDDGARVDELLDLVGLTECAERKPSELSGGQQQRVAIARALATRPKLLLLDEPFANVDAALRETLAAQLQALVEHEGVSVMLVTHDRAEALGIADRVVVMVDRGAGGAIAQIDTAQNVYGRPVDGEVATLVGPAALVPATAVDSSALTALGNVPLLEPRNGRVRVVLRPEAMRFESGAGGEYAIAARVFRGNAWYLRCLGPAGEIAVQVPGRNAPAVGTRGRIVVIDACWAFAD